MALIEVIDCVEQVKTVYIDGRTRTSRSSQTRSGPAVGAGGRGQALRRTFGVDDRQCKGVTFVFQDKSYLLSRQVFSCRRTAIILPLKGRRPAPNPTPGRTSVPKLLACDSHFKVTANVHSLVLLGAFFRSLRGCSMTTRRHTQRRAHGIIPPLVRLGRRSSRA